MKNSKAVKASAARREFAGKLLKAFAGETAAKAAKSSKAKNATKPAPAKSGKGFGGKAGAILESMTSGKPAPAAKPAPAEKAPKTPKAKAAPCSKCGRQNKRPAGASGDCNSEAACKARRAAAKDAAK